MAAALSALALAGCAGMEVNSYVERGVNMADYGTFTWAQPDQRTGDPRLDNSPFFHERLQTDVERQLTRRGYDRIAADQADLSVHYHASINQQVNVNEVDRRAGYCEEDDCQPYAYDAGTLVIDLVDVRTKRVVWRGWAKGSVDGVIDNQDWMEQRLDEVVARIMDKLPRRS
jgi:hypothetical protein